MFRTLPLLTVIVCSALPCLAAALNDSVSNSPGNTLALVGATIWVSPTDEPIRNGVVIVQEGKIAAVGPRAELKTPPGAQVLDCSGMTITAGFWNSHVHFFERKWANISALPAAELGLQLQEFLTRYGFTSAFDTGSMWSNTRQIRDRIESGEVAGPRIRSTGEALIAPHALPPDLVFRIMGTMSFPAPEVADADQATAATRKLLDENVDAIKVHLQPPPPPNPPMPEAAIAAAVKEAHARGKLVFVHPASGADVLMAVRNGVDIVAHTTPHSGPWNQALIEAMKQHNVALTPTLTLWKYYARHDRASAQQKIVDAETEQLRTWVAAGGIVLFGTDLGAIDPDPSEEYALMSASGMSFRQILASLTVAPAERFGESKRLGRVAPGMDADLVVLKGDPARDLHALTAVKYTLRGGKIIYQ